MINFKLNEIMLIFTFSSLQKSNKNTVVLLFLICISKFVSSQSILIDPVANGGFETGTTFSSNSWTIVNGTQANQWVLGTATQPSSGGARTAYISSDGGASNNYSYTYSTTHIYYDVIFPAGESNITLSFDWRGLGKTGHAMLVSLAPTSVTPSAGSPISPNTSIPGAVLLGIYNIQGSYQNVTINIPGNVAGNSTTSSTGRLIFTWQNDNTTGNNPAAAIDNISLVCAPPPLLAGGLYYVGSSSLDYQKLTQIANVLNSSTLTGNVIFELQSDYDGTSGENFPIVFNSLTTDGGNYTATIRPATGVTNRVTSGDPGTNASLITFNGVSNLFFDGRPGGSGVKEWTIRNTRSVTTFGPVFRFINGATNNTLSYLNIESQNTNTSTSGSGNILFGTSNTTTGNSNNTIESCNIRDRSDVNALISTAIYSLGTVASANSGNILKNNSIFNFNSIGINITSTGNGNNWEISGNSFYNTLSTAPSAAQTAINFIPGANSSGNVISGNFIGGSNLGASGLPWVNSGNFQFTGIVVSTANTGSTVSGNVIQNISLTSTGAVSFAGINITGGGVNLLTNIIGDQIAANSITSSGTGLITGILSSSSSTININNNSIANLVNSASGVGNSTRGIINSGSGSISITNNSIHDLYSNSSTTNSITSAVLGIYSSSSTVNQLISGNTIFNLRPTHASAGTYSNAICVSTNTSGGNISLNNIYGLRNTSSSASCALTGIHVNGGNWTVANNMISLSNTTGTNLVVIRGIWDNSAFSSSKYYYNSVFIGGGISSGSVKTYCFLRSNTSAITLRNNLFYNVRTGGTSTNYAIGNNASTPSASWNSSTSNNNFYFSNNVNAMGEWGTGNTSLSQWKSISSGDNSSYFEPPVNVPASSLFVNPSLGDLSINSSFYTTASNLESRGAVIAAINTDKDGDDRPGPMGSVNGGGINTDIGADEFDGTPISKDVGVSALIAPGTCPGMTSNVTFRISNYGFDIDLSTNNLILNSSVTGPNPATFPAINLNTGIFSSGSTIDTTVAANYIISFGGIYEFTGYTVLSGDMVSLNDTLKISVNVENTNFLPLEVNFTGFTGNNINALWPAWEEGVGATTPVITNSLWSSQTGVGGVSNQTAKVRLHSTNKNEWIVSKLFPATTVTTISFNAGITAYTTLSTPSAMGSDDKVELRVSDDCGVTWFTIHTFNAASNLTTSLQAFNFNLGSFNGKLIMLGFYATDGSIANVENYDFHIDNILIKDYFPIDMGAISIPTPSSSKECFTANETIVVRVKNHGIDTVDFSLNPLNVEVVINGPINQSFTSNIVSGILLPDSFLLVTVTTNADLSIYGTYAIQAKTDITGDGNMNNDSLLFSAQRTFTAPTSLPLFVDFTGYNGSNLTTIFPNWKEAQGAVTPVAINAKWVEVTGLGSSTNITAAVNLSSTNKYEWLIGPKIKATPNTLLKFKIAVTQANSLTEPSTMGTDDKLEVKLSADCGLSWITIATYNASSNLTPLLEEQYIDLSGYVNQDIIIGFYATNGTTLDTKNYELHLDDIKLLEAVGTDIGAVRLVTPISLNCYSANEIVSVAIKNMSFNPIDFSVNNATLNVIVSGPVNTTYSVALTSGIINSLDTMVVQVTTSLDMLNNQGNFTFNANTVVLADYDTTNNSMNPSTISSNNISLFPSTVNFNTTTTNWIISQMSGNGTWEFKTGTISNPTLAPFSPNGTLLFNSNYFDPGVSSAFFSPCLNLTVLSNPGIEFYMSQNNAYAFNRDSLYVCLSYDGGNTWSDTIAKLSRYNANYTTPGWKKFGVCLSNLSNSTSVRVAFIAVSKFGDNIAIDDIRIGEQPQSNAGNISAGNTMMCGGNSTILQLLGSTGAIQWQASTDGGVNFSNLTGLGSTSTFYGTGPLYTSTHFRAVVSAQALGVCSAYDTTSTVEITILPVPTVNLGADTSICGPTSYVLNPGPQEPGTNLQWNDGTTNSTKTITTSGTYWVTATNVYTCTVSDTVNITFGAAITASAGVDQTICEGETAILTATGGNSYLWSSGQTSQVISVNPLSTTTYNVIVTGPSGCKDNSSVTINVNTYPTVDLGNDISQCGGSATLEAGNPGNTFLWNTMETGNSIFVTSSGLYFVDVNNNGCLTRDSIDIEINPIPVVDFGNDTVICGTLTLNAGNPGSTYLWNTNSTNQSLLVQSSGIYSVQVTSNKGCIASDDIEVDFSPAPTVNIGSVISTCGEPVILNAQNPGDMYLWNTGAFTQTIVASTSGIYWVEVSNIYGCVVSDSVTVNINPAAQLSLGPDIEQCGGSVTINAANSFNTYNWSNGSTNNTITVDLSGTYILSVTDVNGCSDSDTIKVKINPPPLVNAGSNKTICLGDSVTITANGANVYTWMPGGLNGGSISVSPTNTITYVVTGTNTFNCSSQDSLIVTVETAPEASFTSSISGKTISCVSTAQNATYYFWDFGDGSFIMNQSAIHTYINDDYYSIVHIVGNDCGNDTAYAVVGTEAVGMLDLKDNYAMKIYPNPTTGSVTIKFTASYSERIEIKVMDMNGKIILDEVKNNFKGEYAKQIEMEDLSAGVYMLQILTDKQVLTRKIILNK